MNRIIALAALVALLGSQTAFARQNGPADFEERMGKKLERMEKKLDLTKEQKEKIESILESKKEEKLALHKKKMALRDETHKEIKAVLTPEQAETFEKHKEKRMKKRHKKRGHGRD